MAERPSSNHRSTEINRRSFLRAAGLGSAYLLLPLDLLEALEAAPPKQRSAAPEYASFHPLPAGAVRPDGWLAGWLGKQLVELGSQLPKTSWPFTEDYWQGIEREAKQDEWWPWEQKAYWIDGATRLALVTGDEALLKQVRGPIDYTLTHQRSDGYLGPETFRNPKGGFHRWPQSVLMRGLSAASDSAMSNPTHNDVIVAAVQKHYLGDTASYATETRNIANVEDILWCYERTGDPRLLAMAESAWKEYAALNGIQDGADLGADKVYADGPIDAHGVSYSEISKQPAILYTYTGNTEYLKFAIAAQKRIFDHHMLIDGIPTTSEHYGTITSLDSHETCDISDHTWTWGHMLIATGDGAWGDRVERACFNAGFGAIKKDWKGLQYFSCPNQVIATQTSDHNAMNPGKQMMSYQPNPGQATACCGGDVHRLFPNYAIRMWMQDNHGGLAATLYGPCHVNATVGKDGHPVQIVEKTNYPFDEEIEFTVHTEKPIEFPLSLRIPAWCAAPRLQINGKAHPLPVNRSGFITVARKFHAGDTVTLTLPMQTAVSHWPDNGIGVERGPLVYALPVKEEWTAIVEPKWSTPNLPMWDARPTSAWNYGLAVDPAKLAEEIQFERRPATADVLADPWVNPPVTLSVAARSIESWKLAPPLRDPEKHPEHQRTPALPTAQARSAAGPIGKITLVPYGSTQLRVTIFPNLVPDAQG